MGNAQCPRCGLKYTVWSMKMKPWKCKCGAMLASNIGWLKLMSIGGALLFVEVTVTTFFDVRIPVGALIAVLVIIVMQSIRLQEVRSAGSVGK